MFADTRKTILFANNNKPKNLISNIGAGASFAYSLRQIVNTYNGNSILLRRSSDNFTENIKFVNGQFDTNSAINFLSGSTGYIVTWYDQTGNGRNVTNNVAANQPKLSINTFNGKSTVLFDTNLQRLQGNFGVFTYTGAGDVYVANSSSQAVAGHYGGYLHQGLSLIHISEPTRPY